MGEIFFNENEHRSKLHVIKHLVPVGRDFEPLKAHSISTSCNIVCIFYFSSFP